MDAALGAREGCSGSESGASMVCQHKTDLSSSVDLNLIRRSVCSVVPVKKAFGGSTIDLSPVRLLSRVAAPSYAVSSPGTHTAWSVRALGGLGHS